MLCKLELTVIAEKYNYEENVSFANSNLMVIVVEVVQVILRF